MLPLAPLTGRPGPLCSPRPPSRLTGGVSFPSPHCPAQPRVLRRLSPGPEPWRPASCDSACIRASACFLTAPSRPSDQPTPQPRPPCARPWLEGHMSHWSLRREGSLGLLPRPTQCCFQSSSLNGPPPAPGSWPTPAGPARLPQEAPRMATPHRQPGPGRAVSEPVTNLRHSHPLLSSSS